MERLRKFERLIFYLILTVLPWQFKDVLIAYEAGGFFNEFRSISFWATDLLLILLLLLFLFRYLRQRKSLPHLPFSLLGFLPGLLGLLSLFWTKELLLTLSFSLHFLLAGFLFFYLVGEIGHWKEMVGPLLAGILIQLVVGLIQFVSGHSAGLFFLDESHLDASSKENVVVDFLGIRRLRAYGLTSHPNLLGAWAVFSTFLLALSRPPWSFLAIILGILLALLTFSKTALLMLAVALVAFGLGGRKRAGIWGVALVVFLLTLWPGWQSRFNFSLAKEQRSIEERVSGSYEALGIIKESLPWGVGGGSYVAHLSQIKPGGAPWDYQPVHNLFLLSTAELGVFGMLWWFLLIGAGAFLAWRSKCSLLAWVWGILVLIPALSDHFFWSMQEGRLLLMLVLGVAFSWLLKREYVKIT